MIIITRQRTRTITIGFMMIIQKITITIIRFMTIITIINIITLKMITIIIKMRIKKGNITPMTIRHLNRAMITIKI